MSQKNVEERPGQLDSAVSQAAAGTESALEIRDTELDDGSAGQGHGPGDGPHVPAGQDGSTNRGLGIAAILKRLLLFARPFWNKMILAVLLAIVGAALTVIGPHFLERITNEIEAGLASTIDLVEVRRLIIISVIILVLSFIASYMQARLMVDATQKTSQNLRSSLNKKIDGMPLAYFDKTSHGDTLSRVSNDVDTLSQTLNSAVSSVITGVATLLGASLMMFITEWRMALAGMFAAALGFILSLFIMKHSQKYFVLRQRELGALNGMIEETYSGHSVVRVYNAERSARHEFHNRNEALYNTSWKADFLGGLMNPVMMFVGNLGYVVVCVVGAILVINGTIPIGVIVSFMIYIRMFTNPLTSIAQAATGFQNATAAGTRVFELIDEEEMPDESDKPADVPAVRGHVSFDHVKFGYDPDKTIIHDFSAEVYPGQKVAIVGPTGAGKTTMVNLLMRFYEIDSGEIRIDGVPTSSMRRENVDALFGMVLQDTWMFKGTMRENLVYRTEGVTQEGLDAVVEEVGLKEFIKQLPDGYETVMEEDGALSAGQKQLVTIARAMLADDPLLILDEATSSIDTRTEQLVQKSLDTLTAGRTSFVIAHRLSTIRDADIIFVMRDGDIVETGKHTELLAKGGFYSDLYNSQFDPAE
ncbi:ABC transporter ATP-binding protein [Ancrocorticia sp.]|uniref:ABC transporter ATP-binding protein n=2 Tax=Ancrocorticia sp. TaxID=2593684 RepID=UPI003F91FB6E